MTKTNRGKTKDICSMMVFSLLFTLLCASTAFAGEWINLDGTGEVRIDDDTNTLDGFTKVTWNMWLNQDEFVEKAGIVGKYHARTGKRSYIIRTSHTDGISIVISEDGKNVGTYYSYNSRRCGIRNNNEWTMISVTYDGSLISYYRNGVLCDQDKTTVSSIHDSPSPVRLGGGNNVFFKGKIDEYAIYNEVLSESQLSLLYEQSEHGQNKGQSIPALVYHKVADNPTKAIIITPDAFESQMEYLAENKFTPITVDDFEEWRDGDFIMPQKAIMLYFDDGFSSTYDVVKPVLDAHSYVASAAIVTRYASFTSPNSGYMKWNEIQELVDDGWGVSSHSVTHSHMPSLSESDYRTQLLTSKNLIESKLGKETTSFVFPFHDANAAYTEICAEYYTLCWTQGSTNPSYNFKSTPGDQYQSLRRINVVTKTTVDDIKSHLAIHTDKGGEWLMDEGFGDIIRDTSDNTVTSNGYLIGGATWSGSGDIRMMSMEQTTALPTEDILKKKEKKVKPKQVENGESGDLENNVIDSDEGRAPQKLKKEKIKRDNMNIEEEYYKTYNPEEETVDEDENVKNKNEKKEKKEKKDKDKDNSSVVYEHIELEYNLLSRLEGEAPLKKVKVKRDYMDTEDEFYEIQKPKDKTVFIIK